MGGRERVLLILSLGVLMIVVPDSAFAATVGSPVVPYGQSVAGRSYPQWEAAAWQWRLRLPNNNASSKTSCVSQAQNGPVWFLGWSAFNGTTATLKCDVPAGRYIMLWAPSQICTTLDTLPGHTMTSAALKRCPKASWKRRPGQESVTLDGVAFQPAGYLVATEVFAFQVPARNNILAVSGRTHGRAAVFGAATILRPVSPGTHTFVQVETYAHTSFYRKLTFQITVS